MRDLLTQYKEMHVNTEMYPKAFLDGSLKAINVPLSSLDPLVETDEPSYGEGSLKKLEID